jgi:hypothetical protein
LLCVIGPLTASALAVFWWVGLLRATISADRGQATATSAPADALANTLADTLAEACRETAQHVARQLGPSCHAIVCTPLVVAGDLSEAELQRWHRETIEPAARAMAAAYFTTPPSEPITILLFAGQQSYRRYAAQLFGERQVPRCGYYRPNLRTVVVNLATGGGTLSHELTHALAAFDFPDAPDWLGEGLAALHELATVGPDGLTLVGQSGPRLSTLQTAIREGRLRPLPWLLRAHDFHGANEKLNYAQARYFCLYLQRQGVLGDCYRRLRDSWGKNADDPDGEKAVLGLFPDRTWDDLDADFRQFVAAAD